MLYKIEDGVIVRTDTGKKFRRMKDIVEQMNHYGRTSRYTVRRNPNGEEYIEWVGYTAEYYDIEEICELMNAVYDRDINVICKKHCGNTNNRIGHHTTPYKQGRFVSDHTTRKGFWIEDWLTGKTYYLHIDEHIKSIVGLLNDYTKEGRFTVHDSECGKVIEDTWISEEYVLGDSKHITFIRDFLNNHDYLKYGERDLQYKRMFM